MRTVGKVKWFDAATGEGCALSDGGAQAAFTRATLEPSGLSVIEAGVAVVYDVKVEAGRLIVGAIHEIAGKGPKPAAPAPLRIQGHVHWFDAVKGYGFVVSKDVDADVLLHRSVLHAIGVESLHKGAALDCDVIRKSRGYEVQCIHAVLTPDVPLPPQWGCGAILIGSPIAPDVVEKLERMRPRTVSRNEQPFHPPKSNRVIELPDYGPWENAVCKWFSRPKGYGFLVLAEGGGDIFVHMDVLRGLGVRELRPGQRVQVRVRRTKLGLSAGAVKLDLDDDA